MLCYTQFNTEVLNSLYDCYYCKFATQQVTMDTLQMRISELHQRISNPRSVLSQNCLLDTFVVLYTDCEKASTKSASVKQFIEKCKYLA